MEVGTSKIYDELPEVVTERSSAIIGLPRVEAEDDSAKHQLRDFLRTYLPASDRDEVSDEVRRGFLLTEKKPRIRPRKSLNKRRSDKSQNAPHRGRKRLSGKERRALGLHTVSRNNKTFEMFLPINDMWKKYAQELLNINYFIENGWKGEDRNSKTETIQNKIRKIDYFGCFLRVTKSRCSELIGLQGIVIKETKNTFILVKPDDTVKIVPKLHSEFSFVVDGVGFSIMGNHLHQRAVERAKHNFKKLNLWL